MNVAAIGAEDSRLDEFDMEEWRDILRLALAADGRELDDAEFDRAWADFLEAKRRRAVH